MPVQSANINDTFFEGIYKDVWRKLILPGLSEAECDFIENIAQLQKGDAVLDLMCGYGRHALELGRHGYQITAIDNAADYIAEIIERSKEENLPVDAFVAGALDVELQK